jgi:hypothetical protein
MDKQHHHPITPERIAALHAIRDSITGIEAAPQRTRLITAIQQLQHVSTFEASRFLDVYYAPARKLELVGAGYPIKTVMRSVITEAGKLHRVGVYFLERA